MDRLGLLSAKRFNNILWPLNSNSGFESGPSPLETKITPDHFSSGYLLRKRSRKSRSKSNHTRPQTGWIRLISIRFDFVDRQILHPPSCCYLDRDDRVAVPFRQRL